MNVPSLREQTNAIIEALSDEGLTVGDGVATVNKDGTGDPLPLPHVVVYALPGGVNDGSLGAPDDDTSWVWQTTSVGGTREQAEWMADQVRVALRAGVTIPGRSVMRLRFDMSGGSTRDDDVQPPVWFVADRYRLMTTPTLIDS